MKNKMNEPYSIYYTPLPVDVKLMEKQGIRVITPREERFVRRFGFLPNKSVIIERDRK